MFSTSHASFRTGTVRAEDGCRIRRQRPSRQVERRRAVAEQTGGPR
jgi:hypothetical protein